MQDTKFPMIKELENCPNLIQPNGFYNSLYPRCSCLTDEQDLNICPFATMRKELQELLKESIQNCNGIFII